MPSTTNLRKVGGSVMLTIPPTILDMMDLQAGSEILLEIEGDKLVVRKTNPKRYALEALLAECDFEAPASEEDQLWLSSRSVGREIL